MGVHDHLRCRFCWKSLCSLFTIAQTTVCGFCVTNNQGDCRVNTDDPRSDAASEARRLRRLLEASRLLNSTLELRDLTEIVLRIIQDELPVERCTLFVLDTQQKGLRSLIAQGVEGFEI